MAGHFTPQVQEAMTRLGSRCTYREAVEELERMWGIHVSKGAVHQVTMRYGHAGESLIAEQVQQLEKGLEPPQAKPERLLISSDGAMVQVTTGHWREVKTTVIGECHSKWNPSSKEIKVQTESLSYFSRMSPAEAFTREALYEWDRRGGENAKEVVSVNDGAVWIQSFIDYHCPQATRILDFAHATAYLAQVGKQIYPEDSPNFSYWYNKARHQLAYQPPQRTLSELHLLQKQHDPNEENEEISSAIRYLSHRQEMIDYPHFRHKQLPIGSGVVESGHKVVMQRRMKQAGMRWAEQNVNPMLVLRNFICNQEWDEGWESVSQYHRGQQYKRKTKQKQEKLRLSRSQKQIDWGYLTQNAVEEIAPQPSVKNQNHPWRDNKWPLRHRY